LSLNLLEYLKLNYIYIYIISASCLNDTEICALHLLRNVTSYNKLYVAQSNEQINCYSKHVSILLTVNQREFVEEKHHHHMSVMELGHLLTRSGLTYLVVSSEVCHDSFCQLGNSV
jgi:hypothetical protein